MATLDNFIPVNPLLDATGQFISLANYTDLPIKPNPLAGADPGRSEYGQEYKISYSVSSKLEVTAIGGVETKFGATTFVHDSIIYKLSRAKVVGGSPLVLRTCWGYGIRLKVSVSNVEMGLNIGWGNLAASVQLGYADASFELESIGISDSGLFDLLPAPMDLNIDTFNDILSVGNEFRRLAHTADPAGIIYQPVRIEVNNAAGSVDPLTDDKHLIFTYKQIADRQRLKNAKAAALQKNLDPKLITRFYKEVFSIENEDEKPAGEKRDKAEEWLNV